LFLINVPISIIIVIVALFNKDESIIKPKSKMDITGSVVLSLLILSLMYAITNLNFANLLDSFKSKDVYPFLIAFVILIPIFIIVERKAIDPVLNLKFFKDKDIVLTLIVSFIVGCAMMSLIFIPQFGANVLRLNEGSGGYLVTWMAIFTGLASPIGGKLIDKFTAKFVLTVGFITTIIGCLILSLITAKTCDHISLYIGLIALGLGMGFTMGTPLNYLIQAYVKKDEATSGQSTVSLIRSIGVAIAPNLLVNFLSDAGKQLPDKLMKVLPSLNIPGVNLAQGAGNMSTNMANTFQNASVNNIVDVVKEFISSMLHGMQPMLKHELTGRLPANMSVDTF
ncbi:MAG: MFS transporter, partial [Sarcina sp.]